MDNKLDQQYQTLLQTILDFGVEKKDRTGTGTKSIFGYTIRHRMKDGFPLLTTKKMAFKTMVTELLWFLRGDTNIKYLVDNNCHIWDGDAYKRYVKWVESPENQNNKYNIVKIPISKEDFIKTIKGNDEILKKMGKRYCDEFAKQWGELGPVYGKQWRSWRVGKGIETTLKTEDGETIYEAGSMYIDQIANLISELKTNPDSRRMMVNAYNVGELDQMVLPPCHYGFQVYTRELSLEERYELMKKLDNWVSVHYKEPKTMEYMDKHNIPTRAISLMYNCRSQDVPLGTPFNISSYALLLEIIAKMVNMVSDELIANMGDCHIYLNQIDGVKEQLTREPYELPIVKLSDRVVNDISEYILDDIKLEGYQSHPTIKLPLSN
jgi:thymidylate synthase